MPRGADPPSSEDRTSDTWRASRRILVAGNDGSGKTTLCRRLAELWDLPYTELDALRFGPDWTELPGFIDAVRELADRPEWITEWDFDGAREILGARAALFVWIDLPRWRNAYRTLRRSVLGRLRRERLWGDTTEPPLRTILTNRWHSVRVAIQDHDDARRRAEAFIREHPATASVRLTTPRAVADFMRRAAQ